MAVTRWGFLSAGQIAHEFAATLQHHPPGQHKVVAVAARSLEKAKEFGVQFSVPKCYGSYQALVNDKDIDIIYVSPVHPFHYRNCLLALHAGKHVLCEKPVCMNLKEATEVINLAKEKKVFFMEGHWSRFFPLYKVIRDEVETGVLGDIRMIVIDTGFNMLHNYRYTEKDVGGGVTLAIGSYLVSFTNMIMKGKPQKIVASGELIDTGVDLWSSVVLHYSGGRAAVVTCHMGTSLCSVARVYGSKGHIEVPKFWAPASITTPTGTHTEPLPELPNYEEKPLRFQGFVYEQAHVRECLLKGLTESPIMPHEDSLDIIGILDEIRRQIGVTYDADD